MIKCWGKKFKNVRELWEHPRCYVATVGALRHRLKKLPPEEAVRPEFKFLGKKFKSIYALHYEVGLSLSRTELYRRLGFIVNGRKVTVLQATSPGIWVKFKKLKNTGKFGTVLK